MCADMALRNESVLFRSLLSRNVYGISNGLEKFGIPQTFGLFVTAGRYAGRHKGSFIICLFVRILFRNGDDVGGEFDAAARVFGGTHQAEHWLENLTVGKATVLIQTLLFKLQPLFIWQG